MNQADIQAAYAVAKLVYEGSLNQGEGARRLHTKLGLNINSAHDLIADYRHLLRGESFQRGLSAPDMDYFLTYIAADSGPTVLQTALQSLWLHIRYYEGIRKVTLHKLRAVASRHQSAAAAPRTIEQLNDEFETAVNLSRSDSPAKRRKRLSAAARVPSRSPVVAMAFDRNPDVVAEVLHRAGSSCERCKKAAPFFRRKDDSPYLEVHHIQQLALGGEDTVKNAVALCPNCHRELHYGKSSGV